MKAYVLTDNGPRLSDAPVPAVKPNEILVKVRASALNRADLAMLQGHDHGGAGGVGAVLGLEWAGDVVELGADVTGLQVGDRVMCSGGGAFGEYAKADWGRVLRIPAGLSYQQAATLPVALLTMHDAIVTNGRLQPGESVLIQGASAGVGLMALQIAKRMGAKLVIGTSTTPARRERLAEFGADMALDSSDPGWVDQVLEATDGRGVDLIVDQLAGPVANQNLRAARVLGRIVNVGRLAGRQADFDFDLHALRRIDYIGVTFRTRSLAEVREISRRAQADLGEALQANQLRIPIDRTFTLDTIADALSHMASNAHFGKIVVTV